ncbi:MAG: peptidylprolyl isomerase [Mariprofundaceae bacterium]|nr:peptidylprolyl isomerase [Mariprofundaceae bacterium]
MFKKTTQTLISIGLAFSLGACQFSTPEPPLTPSIQSPALVVVGTRTITQADVDAELRSLPEQIQEHMQRTTYQHYILQTLIRRAVLSQRAMDVGMANHPEVQRRIQRNRDSIMIEALKEWKVKQLPTPQESTIQQYYQQHLADFTMPEQVHVRQILVHDKQQALRIYSQLIHKQHNFDHFVMRYTLKNDANQPLGGDLNWFVRGTMLPAFEKAAFALKKIGDISHPVHTKFGWHIIELLGHQPESITTIQDVYDDIVQILRQRELDKWVDNLVKESSPSYFTPHTNKR